MISLNPDRIILGCGNFGGVGSTPSLIGFGETKSQAFQLLDAAKGYGILQFDTANSYGGGLSEDYLGQWIQQQTPSYRHTLEISTKVGNPFATTAEFNPLSFHEINLHLQNSLNRLGIDRIKTYYLHQPDFKTPLQETLQALDQALMAGDIETIGLSNVDLHYVQRFLSYCNSSVRRAVRYVQNEFHFLKQIDKFDLIPFLVKEKINYVAFSPLAGGLLTGKYQSPGSPPIGSRLDLRPEPYENYRNTESSMQIREFIKLARSYGQDAAAFALDFVLQTNGIHSAIIGPRRKEHFENFGFKRARYLGST